MEKHPMRVWKFRLGPGENAITMPPGATVLSVIEQQGSTVMYAAVRPPDTIDLDVPSDEVTRHFLVVDTGAKFEAGFPAQADFVGSIRCPGEWVRHVFETMAPEDEAEAEVEAEAVEQQHAHSHAES